MERRLRPIHVTVPPQWASLYTAGRLGILIWLNCPVEALTGLEKVIKVPSRRGWFWCLVIRTFWDRGASFMRCCFWSAWDWVLLNVCRTDVITLIVQAFYRTISREFVFTAEQEISVSSIIQCLIIIRHSYVFIFYILHLTFSDLSRSLLIAVIWQVKLTCDCVILFLENLRAKYVHVFVVNYL